MASDAVTFTNSTFLSEELKLKLFTAQPRESRPCPVVLVNHGGGGPEPTYEGMCLQLAEIGYYAVAMTFRGYYGSEGNQEYGKGEIRDLLNLVNHLKSETDLVDPSRLGMFGYSRGALNALLTCEQSRDFKAVAVWSAPVDMIRHHRINPFIEDLIGGEPDELPEEYRLRSPIHFVDWITCPVLIIHGEMDEVIPVEHAYMLASELKGYGKEFELRIYPGEEHIFTPRAFYSAWKETISFLNKYLRPTQGKE